MNQRISIRNGTSVSSGASPLMISSSAVSESSKNMRDDVLKIHQDCKILAQRIANLKGEPLPKIDGDVSDNGSVGGASSPFVNGIRSMAENDRKFNGKTGGNNSLRDEKLQALETFIEKITEYERLLMTKTAPEPVSNGTKVRRKSFGSDLSTIPTHLHLTDRLVDFHTQSKRVTVIKTTGKSNETSAAQPVDVEDKKSIEKLQHTVAQLTKQCAESDNLRQQGSSEIAKLKDMIEQQKMMIAEFEKRPVPSPVPPIEAISPEELAKLRAEVASLKASNAEKDKSIVQLHERLEVEIGTVQGTLRVLMGKAAQINAEAEGKDTAVVMGGGDDCITLPDDMKNGIHTLQCAISNRLNNLKSELHLIMSVKDLLESDLSTSNTQNDMLQKDLSSVSEEYQALKAAYDSLSYETARSQEMVQSAKDTQSLLERSNQVNDQLETELCELKHRLLEFDKLAEALAQAEDQLRVASSEKAQLVHSTKGLEKELQQYKTLTEVLKEKVREMGRVGNTSDSKDFLDTFEEVMREEMMTMKAAFEAKLKLAKEEAEETSKRHQQEILRLHSSSPLTLRSSGSGILGSSRLSNAGTASILGGSSKGIALAAGEDRILSKIGERSTKTTSDMTGGSFQLRL